MTATRQRARPRVGELRPSQLLQTFGVGAVVDLPHLSVTVMGLDDWNTGFAEAVTEERLLAAVRHHLGSQVAALRTPPYLPETSNPFDEWGQVGVPVAVFPRWLRCPRCNLLAPISSGLFTLKTELVRTDRTRYVHTNCSGKGKAPDVLAARFLLACPAGHLDDFPWVEFVHQGASCSGPVLELRETGVSGLAADVQVRCRTCNTPRRMAQAFGEEARGRLPRCRGRHPHLASFGTSCDEPVRTILLGASNAWFAVGLSVLSIPVAAGPLAQKVAERWADLQRITSPEVLAFARGEPKYATFAAYTDAELWGAIEARRSAGGQEAGDPADLLGPEWAAFSDPAGAPAGDDFRLRPEAPPSGFAGRIAQVVLAERLREVQALVEFTRVDAPDEPRHGTERMWAPLARNGPLWVPCAEVRGEGVLLRLAEQPLTEWERRVEGSDRAQAFAEASARWRHARGLPPAPWPGMRFTLLHTLAHLLIREFALECGYGAAGLAERLYAEETDQEPMAGLLLYTAAPDSEGTLGGLVELGDPDRLGQLLAQALDHARLCSSDPLCAEHEPGADGSLHGAACHACLFAAETSCQAGNRFLDRSLLVDTLGPGGLEFFAHDR